MEERSVLSCRGRITALFAVTAGKVSFPRDEEDRPYVTILPSFTMTPHELTAVVLEIKSHKRFRVSSMSRDEVTILVPDNVEPRKLIYEASGTLLDIVDIIDKLHCKPPVNSADNNAASRSWRETDKSPVRAAY